MFNYLYQYKGWIVNKSTRQETCHLVELRVDQRCVFLCPKCHKKLITHSYRDIYVQDLPAADKHVFIKCQVPQGFCPSCRGFHTVRPQELHPSMGFTWRLMKYISGSFRFIPARHLAVQYGISASTIRRIDQEVLSRSLPPVNRDHLKAILIDEKYLGKSVGFVTHVLNANTGEPLYMARGRSVECLDSFFSSLSRQQRQSIQCVGIDRSNTYKAAVEKHLPHANICFDRFHMISNLNAALDQVRREELRKASEMDRRVIANSRYLLLRGKENVPESARARLELLLGINKNISASYVLKEEFREIWNAPNPNAGQWRLSKWLRMAQASEIGPLKRFAQGLLRNLKEVVNSFRYGVNNGKIESANATLSRIQSKTCGLFNVPYLFLKLRQCFYQRI